MSNCTDGVCRTGETGGGTALAPELHIAEWLNTSERPTLAGLRGKVVLLEFFQMLCPGCVSHALPQAQKLHRTVRHPNFQVIGVHSVFEHHDAMTPNALRAFAHEYRLEFPIGIDAHEGRSRLPRTMADYELRGTPSTVLVGADGRVRLHAFGAVDDIALGVAVGQALAELDQQRWAA